MGGEDLTCQGWHQTHHIIDNNSGLLIFPSPLPKYWNYRFMWCWGSTQALSIVDRCSPNSQILLLKAHGHLQACPQSQQCSFKGLSEGKKQWSGVTCRLLDPHTNVGSLALALMGARVWGKGPLAHHLSPLLALGLSHVHRFQNRNVISIWTSPFSSSQLTANTFRKLW